MQLDGLIHSLPKYLKQFIAAFVIVLSVGYFTGLNFVQHTDSSTPNGIEENYLGNEDIEDITVMKFKKSEREMMTILHTHILSIAFIFFLLGGIVSITSLPKKLKGFLILEPFFSILITFGGIYFMWQGLLWLKYIVMISGIVMTLVFIASVLLILLQLIKKPSHN